MEDKETRTISPNGLFVLRGNRIRSLHRGGEEGKLARGAAEGTE